MHEFSICRQIISEAKKHGSPAAIKIEVGELANITPSHLKEHMEEYVDWKIEIKKKNGYVVCKCGYKGKPLIRERSHSAVLMICPRCKDNKFLAVSGDRVILKSVMVK
jgi:Zn finger protein HypA/HybF involved in hydrogenase expression